MSVDEKSTNPLAMKHGSGWVDHREPRKTVSASLHVLCFSLFWGSIWQSCPQHPEYHGVAKLDRKRANLGWLKMVDQDEWFWCQMEVSRNGGIPIKIIAVNTTIVQWLGWFRVSPILGNLQILSWSAFWAFQRYTTTAPTHHPNSFAAVDIAATNRGDFATPPDPEARRS